MIKVRVRWCTCRVENILTLGRLLSLWFWFLLHSILFLISQTSYRTYKNNFKLWARSPHNGNHFSSIAVIGWTKWAPHWGVQSRFRVICVCRGPKCVRRITWPNKRMLKVSLGRLKLNCDTRVIHYNYYARAALARTRQKRNIQLEMRKQSELQWLKNRGKKCWGKDRK